MTAAAAQIALSTLRKSRIVGPPCSDYVLAPDDAGAFVSACGPGARIAAVARPTSRSKLKSEGVLPVMSREPRLLVRYWNAHFRKTTTRLWNWTRYMTWTNTQMSHAGSPARWTPNTFATAAALPM